MRSGGVALAAGGLLLLAYFVIRQLLPEPGLAEFAYSPFTPEFHLFAPLRGFTVEQGSSHLLRALVLGPALLLLSVGCARALELDLQAYAGMRRLHLWAGGLSLAVTAYVMFFVLRGRPIVDDEVTYAGMASTFLQGRLAEPLRPGVAIDTFEVVSKLGVAGKYLFGEPLVQLPGVWLGMPALPHLAMNALTLVALYQAVQLFWSDRALSATSCALLALSPMFMLCGATGQSQSSSLTCVTLSILGYALATRGEGVRGGLLAGAAAGFGLAVRPQTMAPVGLVLGCAFLLLARRQRKPSALASFAGAALCGVALIAAYDLALTGDVATLPWFLQGRGTEHYGFGRVWDHVDFVHSPLGALQNLLVVAVRMNAWWLGWPLALLLLFRRGALRRVWSDAPIFLWVALAIVVFELGYYSTGISDVGPIYHFELLLALSVVGAHILVDLWRTRPQLALAGVVVHVLLGTGSFVYEESERLGRVADLIHIEAKLIMARLPERSLLLYDSDCSRVIRLGWMYRSFSGVTHDPRARVVSYGRPLPQALDAFVASFPGRSCFYLHHPDLGKHELLECGAARKLLLRPIPDSPACPYVPSTAQQLGWFDPTLFHARQD